MLYKYIYYQLIIIFSFYNIFFSKQIIKNQYNTLQFKPPIPEQSFFYSFYQKISFIYGYKIEKILHKSFRKLPIIIHDDNSIHIINNTLKIKKESILIPYSPTKLETLCSNNDIFLPLRWGINSYIIGGIIINILQIHKFSLSINTTLCTILKNFKFYYGLDITYILFKNNYIKSLSFIVNKFVMFNSPVLYMNNNQQSNIQNYYPTQNSDIFSDFHNKHFKGLVSNGYSFAVRFTINKFFLKKKNIMPAIEIVIDQINNNNNFSYKKINKKYTYFLGINLIFIHKPIIKFKKNNLQILK